MAERQQVIDFDAIFARYMAGNKKVWEHDRSSTLGASENFSCLRQGWFNKLGPKHGFVPDEEPDAKPFGAMERGNLIEKYYLVPGIRAGLPEGMSLLMAGDDQPTLVVERLSATPDGLITGLRPGPLRIVGGDQDILIPDIRSDCIVIEFKSIDPRATLVEERAKHHGQTQIQIGAIREKTEWKPYYSVILYVDASFIDRFTPFVVEFDEAIYAAAKRRAHDLWTISDPMMVVPEGRFSGACATCPWKTACMSVTIDSIPKYEEPSNPEALAAVAPLVADVLRLRKESEDIEQRYKEAQERVKEVLLDHGTKKLSGDEWNVSWGPVQGKEALDTAAMEADGIDLSKYKRRGQGHDRLYVTPKVKKTKKATA